MRIGVIGLGGIGSVLLYPLARYLSFSGEEHELVLIDGDEYEAKNLARQDIDEGCLNLNKAQASAGRVSKLFESLEITAISEFVNRKSAKRTLSDLDVIFVCVDNHMTRKIVQDQCVRMLDVLLITGGNELLDGNVQVYIKHNGKEKTPTIYKHHPEIASPSDATPDDESCEELAEGGNEQIIFTNLTAASLMLNAFYAATTGKVDYSEVYFDITQNKATAVKRD